jgi:spermidine synthase
MTDTAILISEVQHRPLEKLSKAPKMGLYYLLFFLSGFPALLYQIVWQRALFTAFGVNVESVTIIVTVFMLGLGLGSLAGGRLSAQPRVRLLLAFGAIEITIGIFGACSLPIFHRVASFTAGGSVLITGLVSFALLLVPTLLMGSTLPLLVEHFVRRTGNVGESVGLLYAVNTFGSGVACFAAAEYLMKLLGETGAVHLAACFNLFVGVSALVLQRGVAYASQPRTERASHLRQQTIPLWVGMLLAGATGFVALAYEIIWYRLYAFTSGSLAPTFAELLAFYLFGIAYGSMAVRDACRKKLGNDIHRTMAATSQVVLLGAIAAFLLGPALARWVVHFPYGPTYTFIFVAAALLGAAFPLLSHAAIDPDSGVGKSISLLYLSNIVGSTLGSFLIGFFVLDYWSARVTSLLLLGMGVLVSAILAVLAGPKVRKLSFAAGCAVCLALALSSSYLFSGMYERLLFKTSWNPTKKFSEVLENRSGVIAVYPNAADFAYPTSTLFGSGVYDGRFNIDMMHDSNGLFRAFAVAGMHPVPKHVLMIGLASGSWAQIIVNCPGVEDFTIVEIDRGYLSLISHHAEVASLLTNPKVHIVIDDGRRWLVGHPDQRFDFIVMNTTFNYRANISNLLSTEFMTLLRAHLSTGGIAYYNTTWSDRAFATGVSVFPYALRFSSFLAVSDQPFSLDENRSRSALTNFQIDGRPVFDQTSPAQRAKMDEVLHLADQLDAPNGQMESRSSLVNKLRYVPVITDDNMGTEWQ